SGQDDLAIGTYSGNRGRAELENLIGFFINTLVLRLDLTAEPTFAALLDQAREVTLEAFAHQELPFEKLLEALHVERDLSHTPLFQALLVVQNFPEAVALSAESELTQLTPEDEHANFDLALWLSEGGDQLTGLLQYNTDLFDVATVDRFGGQLVNLLAAAVEDPERRVSDLPLVSAAERAQLLAQSRAAAPALSAETPVHELFAAQAERTPDAVAVVGDGRAIAYRELRERAGDLARHLRTLGVGPETIVGLAAERSPEALTGMLGVLEAGGAYLPLDPAYPEERLAFMLANSRAPVLLAGAGLEDRFRQGAADGHYRLVPLAAGAPGGWTAGSGPPPRAALSPDHPAYVIYTSGSTGQPKGVVVPHRALAAYALDAAEAYEVQPSDRALQFASISFDTSAEEIYPCLIRGATLVLRSAGAAGTAAQFLREVESSRITLLNLPTAYWHELVGGLVAESADAALPPLLRRVVIGGERALPERLAAWQAGTAGSAVRLVNTYGPTETTIVATRAELTRPPRLRLPPPAVPLGRPIRGAVAYCVDRRGEPVPVGVAGELWIGGSGIARGYLNRPDLTAAAFVPDSFATGRGGGRLYRSGDLARFRPNGDLEFVGRLDGQVKVRGFRVEPGEIEGALTRYPRVQSAAVVARPDASAALQLVAYVTPREGVGATVLTTTELRRFLAAHLPEHLIPAVFVVLAELPLTGSGKVDRRALPAPESDRPLLEREYAAPESPVEEALCAIWAAALGIERVGVDDNFFELGGHSLLATQVIAQIRERLDVELPLITLFQMPTVAQLAVQVEEIILDQIEQLEDGEVQELL
ncbi:MAG TPA: amino acid adenylation domain-containing protein, partial [Thermoanaerobaculia bacterium]